MSDKPKIVVFSGPTATIQNSPPLRTSGPDPIVRTQRLAAKAVVYIEALSAHPLELDAADLYAPPDGYLDAEGTFVALDGAPLPEGRTGVYRVELDPSDGPLMLPYVARTVAGEPWMTTGLSALAPEHQSRQTFYPDASRLYEEIDRFGLDGEGRSQLLSRQAEFTFVRAIPSSGYRSDRGAALAGLDAAERRGVDYFGYFPRHLHAEPGPANLAKATNIVQEALSSGEYLGAQWLEGSPTTEESLYWLNLVIDTTLPIVGHAAQRPHQTLSADGDRNIVDGATYITSGIWADEQGRDIVGGVMIVDEVIFAAREVAKTDARPGNYVATGGHGGIVGTTGVASGSPKLTYVPVRKHTYQSEVRLSLMPETVSGVRLSDSGAWTESTVAIKDSSGKLIPEAMPVVEIVKYGRYAAGCCGPAEVEALVAHFGKEHRLAAIVCEGMSPYGGMNPWTDDALRIAAHSGFPIVRCGRGNTGGFTSEQRPYFIKGGNLTSTKARILVMACLLRFGALPAAGSPLNPTDVEEEAIIAAVGRYQEIFDTH